LLKSLKLYNLGAYWISNEKKFFTGLPENQITEVMKAMIIPDIEGVDPKQHEYYSQYVLLLNLESRLYQNRKGDFDKPEFTFDFELKTINLTLENLQLQQIIKLAELLTLFQSKLA
jgi:hypothetical protein